MTTKKQDTMVSRHMADYAKLIQAEAEKNDVLGVNTKEDLFDKAQEVFYLADEVAHNAKTNDGGEAGKPEPGKSSDGKSSDDKSSEAKTGENKPNSVSHIKSNTTEKI